MLSLLIFTSLMLTFAICTGISAYLWKSRHSSLHRLVVFTQMAYATWAFLILGTMASTDFSSKVLLTEIRQLFLPALAPTWLLIGIGIFYRPLWEKLGKWRYLIYALPIVVIFGHLCSMLGLPFAKQITFFDFREGANPWGLLEYKLGWLISLSFSYIYICILLLYLLYVCVIITKPGIRRKYAFLLLTAGILTLTMEFTGRILLKDFALVQLSVAAIWPAALALHYAVARMEFLDIGVLAQESIFENLPNPVIISDARNCFWNANKEAFKVFNLNSSQIGKSLENLSSLKDLNSQTSLTKILGVTYQVLQHELSLRNGEESARVFIFNDITDLQESREALQNLNGQILNMVHFNRKVQTVLSHDLSGSLVGVDMLLREVEEQLENKSPENLKMAISQASRSNLSSLELLRDLLTWTHKEESSHFGSVNQSLQEALRFLQPQLLARKVSVVLDLPTEDITLAGSNKVLESIFRNLLSNAIKFSKSGMEVQARILVNTESVEIHFIDQGVGLSPQKMAQILSGEGSLEASGEGFGLGMKLTVDFIRQLNGKLEIESEVGLGSRFKLTLPRA